MIPFEHFKQLNYEFLRNKINSIDLRPYSSAIQNETYRKYFIKNAGAEHYKLLAFFSMCFENHQLFDIGTHIGGSSIALAFNSKNVVVSYDVVNCRELQNPPSNIIYEIGDFRLDSEVLSSPFIFIDVDHNGNDEIAFHEFFLKNKYRGVVLWDDIHLNPNMKHFWNSVELEKLDLTGIGHETGTGLVIYN